MAQKIKLCNRQRKAELLLTCPGGEYKTVTALILVII